MSDIKTTDTLSSSGLLWDTKSPPTKGPAESDFAWKMRSSAWDVGLSRTAPFAPSPLADEEFRLWSAKWIDDPSLTEADRVAIKTAFTDGRWTANARKHNYIRMGVGLGGLIGITYGVLRFLNRSK